MIRYPSALVLYVQTKTTESLRLFDACSLSYKSPANDHLSHLREAASAIPRLREDRLCAAGLRVILDRPC